MSLSCLSISHFGIFTLQPSIPFGLNPTTERACRHWPSTMSYKSEDEAHVAFELVSMRNGRSSISFENSPAPTITAVNNVASSSAAHASSHMQQLEYPPLLLPLPPQHPRNAARDRQMPSRTQRQLRKPRQLMTMLQTARERSAEGSL